MLVFQLQISCTASLGYRHTDCPH